MCVNDPSHKDVDRKTYNSEAWMADTIKRIKQCILAVESASQEAPTIALNTKRKSLVCQGQPELISV